jgi:hypothetical protein
MEDLKTKRAWFEANQELATKEKLAKAEVEIDRVLKSIKKDTNGGTAPVDGAGEAPVDPAPAPAPEASL